MAAQMGGNAGKGNSLMKTMLQRMMLGNRTPARSNREGIGRFLAPLLVGLAAQGIQSWKNNYDARGRAKADADAIMERYRQTGQITDAERAELAKMNDKYKDKYPARWDIGTPPAQAAPQGTGQPFAQGGGQPPPPQDNQLPPSALAQAIQQPAQAPEVPNAFQELTSQSLSDTANIELQEAIKGMSQNDKLEEILKKNGLGLNIFGG